MIYTEIVLISYWFQILIACEEKLSGEHYSRWDRDQSI